MINQKHTAMKTLTNLNTEILGRVAKIDLFQKKARELYDKKYDSYEGTAEQKKYFTFCKKVAAKEIFNFNQ